ncbi:PEPxxWA-CTERM sorting domain-containing protein [Blastomonas aquatica]|uniref:PEPxxWA-CTERM sorting domain-containing protein n=1 Tax=Blastomonas aquatica TaxID=1510276 RepID=UPI0035712848
MVIAFGQHDRRGLLLFDQPEAFAASELAELSSPGGLAQGIGVRRILPSRIGARQIARAVNPGSVQAPAPGASGPAGVGSTIGLQPFVLSGPEPSFASDGTSPGQGLGQSGPVLTSTSVPGTGISPTPLIVPSGPGVVPTEPGIVPTVPDVTDPVVPAVPEPASWILMIIGIGALGAVMRRRQYTVGQLVAGR